jgi:hypothetical protein
LINSILRKPFTKKRAGGVAQGVGPEFKPQYCKKKKKKSERGWYVLVIPATAGNLKCLK